MAFLNRHFTDEVEYEKAIGNNEFNEKEYEEPETIKCRYVRTTQTITLPTGEVVAAKAKIYTDTEIFEFDKINGSQVLQINEWKRLYNNQVVGYKVFI